jgi:DNA invertase Pin-like site-specific DNA recombinase
MSDDRQEMSPARQRQAIEAYIAKPNGLKESSEIEIVAQYLDEGISGDETVKRRQFMQMLQDAQRGKFDCILVDDKDRFGRFDAIDLGEIVAPLRRKGVWLETAAQGKIDWNSFSGRVTDCVLQEAKMLEQAAMSRRQLTSQIMRAKNGKNTGGRQLYGFKWVACRTYGKRMVADGRKAEVIRLIFERYANGATLCAIAEELWRKGVPSPLGKPRWTRSVIQRILRNRRYTGDHTWGVHAEGKRYRYSSDGVRETGRQEKVQDWVPADAWIVVPGIHEALVDRDTFERVQARLKANQTSTNPRGQESGFVLSRLMTCSHCGSRLIGVTIEGERQYLCRGYIEFGKTFCHRNRVREGPLVKHLIRVLRKEFLDPAKLELVREEMRRQLEKDRSPVSLTRLEAQIDAVGRRLERAHELLIGVEPGDENLVPGIKDQIRKLQAEQGRLQLQLREHKEKSPMEDYERLVAEAESALWRLDEALQGEDRPQLREALQEMVSRIEVRWTHRQCGSFTRAALEGGTVYLRPNAGLFELYPSACPWKRWMYCSNGWRPASRGTAEKPD